MDGVFSVGEVVRYLGDILAEDLVLSGLWVQGEISNLSHSTAGHTYFTLKDEECQLRSVIFRGSGATKAAVKQLKNGDQILTHGRLGVYEVQGSVQLYVDHIQAAGVGILHQRFEELCAKLRAEGLFEDERKRPLPALPLRIGVVTSAQAAAFQDICRVLATRFPAVEVVLAATLVQGVEAPSQIVAAIEHLGTLGDIDVIIVARGGGSIEDLWAFNEEEVARAIIASPVPVVTGVGHETDFTVADFVSDFRAPTPSAAAMAVVPDREVLLAQIASLREDLALSMTDQLAEWRYMLDSAQRELSQRSPSRKILQWRQLIDDQLAVLTERLAHDLELKRERLQSRQTELELLHPMHSLNRGYALITDANGSIVRDVAWLHTGERIQVQMRDGSADATVNKVTSSPPR
ncbi:MAG: Exodeoxyribonuclease 7 large subunit [Chloroflexi bacterium]|nr:Exodeoxyribonuclease 7 large subunit [Chloroflexota bacterium]